MPGSLSFQHGFGAKRDKLMIRVASKLRSTVSEGIVSQLRFSTFQIIAANVHCQDVRTLAANRAFPKGTDFMLSWRLLMSAILVPSLVALFWVDHSLGSAAPLLLVFCSFVAVRNAFELTDLLNVRAMRPQFAVVALLSLLVVFNGWGHVLDSGPVTGPLEPLNMLGPDGARLLNSLGWIGAALTAAFCFLVMLEAVRYEQPGRSMESLGANLITVFYAGGLMAVTAQMRWFPNPQAGYFVIASMIICVKSGDTCAYTFGRLWGKRKMAPKLSPGKTWMGLVGAIVGSTVGGWVWLTFGAALFDVKPVAASLWIVLGYSASLGIIGLVGDLCESLIKRDVQKKDSAALMPGFGGLLDLLDSPLFAGPFALAWWHLLPPAEFLS